MFRELDPATWKRRDTFRFFRNYDDPFFNITGEIDVTQLYHFSKKHGLSFSLASLYYSLKAANKTEEFRIRLMGGRLVIFDIIHAGTTILHDDDTFTFCYLEMADDVFGFVENSSRKVAEQKAAKKLEPRDDHVNLIHYSVVPWVAFTAIKHARRFGTEDTVPKIVFGKMTEENGRRKMPLSVEVHHAIMDGVHVGRYFNLLQEIVDNLL